MIGPALVWRVACDIGAQHYPVHADRQRPRGTRRVGPALLRERHGAQADPGRAAHVAEPVAGAEAAGVVAAGDEHRAPAPRGRLQVLDRDQLAAPRQRRAVRPHPAPEPNRLAGAQRDRRGVEDDAAAHPQRERATRRAGLEPRPRRRRRPRSAARARPGARAGSRRAARSRPSARVVGTSAPREGRETTRRLRPARPAPSASSRRPLSVAAAPKGTVTAVP